MSDRYIDQFETLAYGPFGADQIEALVVPIDPDYKNPLQHIATRLHRRHDRRHQGRYAPHAISALQPAFDRGADTGAISGSYGGRRSGSRV